MWFRSVPCAAATLALAVVVAAAWSPPAHGDGGRQRPVARASGADRGKARLWPVKGGRGAARPAVVRGWEPPPEPWAAGHRGVDLAAPRGSPVRAVAGGRVSFAGRVAGRGVVSVELPGTGRPPLRTTYEPVRASVRKGRRVRAGQILGTAAGAASHCRGGCLHWGVRKGERYLDPLSLLPASVLRGGPSRLLPVFGVPLPESGGAEDTGDGAGRGGDAAISGDRNRADGQDPGGEEAGGEEPG
ncbi:M23 family metallopeptidase [Streptomyces sp. HNM0575]|nr:M23 family metallopeptidase [Streptomyces sp. HNM0575]